MKRQTINIGLVICGGLTAMTGLLMLFHYESHLIIGLHEIASLATLFFCFLHIKVNWRPLTMSFGNKGTLFIVLGILAGSAIFMLFTGGFDYKEREIRQVVQEKFGMELPERKK